MMRVRSYVGRSGAPEQPSELARAARPQAKLEVGAPGDRLEQEADRAAEQVMRAPASGAAPLAPPPSVSPARVQRACAACADDEKVQRQAAGDGSAVEASAPDQVARVRGGGGEPMPGGLRAFFEPRFGHDFGAVRVHHDQTADRAARSVQARAYTLGRDIVFAGGQYQPSSDRGRALIAHELAHVVQQGHGARPLIQRATHDFDIRGKFDDSASFANLAFFTEGGAVLDAPERAKVDAFALPAGAMLTLNGFASEEGSAAANVAITNARLAAVAAELVAKGHDPAKITKVPLPASGKGRIDYRRLRSVEILAPGAASSVPSAAAAATAACAGSNETDFKDAEDAGEKLIDKTVAKLGPPVDATLAPLLTRFFSGWAPADAATIKSNLSSIKAQLHLLLPAARHQCGTIKYAACESGADAENNGSGAAAVMTMCPSFFDPASSKKERGGTLVHEASHGTPGLVTDDNAYAHERLIEFLDLPTALKNSDSYTLLVRLFDTPGSMRVGPAVPDVLSGGMGAGEQLAARRSMAWMEKWLIWAYQEMSSLYDTIVSSIAAGAWTNSYYKGTMGLVAPLFGLTAPPALATKADQVKVAAIHDRFHIMRMTEKGTSVTLHKTAAPADTWAAGPGTSVDLSAAFFADSPRGQLDRLLTAIAKATPDVSAAFVAKYVTLADKIRIHGGGGGP